ncbi:hypothetical protein [Sphingomonas sp. CARO-RG-8B-R24-01]|uniref:hypothetical protein n=1 Tax=Sphingomonas sp. CARO-RG-8B-R24-01 TaxID=2914831 RepID=UPI001F58CB78|nr:hypothetical protein [Sphingomonas sp. CARO-RG-8B-R24-01]
MQTPYDAALRALDREMDALTQVIAASSSRLAEARLLHLALSEKIAAEARLAAGNCLLLSDSYLARARDERERRAAEADAAEVELDLLRHRAARQYATIRAVESAADVFRNEVRLAEDREQQALVDDMSAARFVRLHSAKRPQER